MEQWPAIDKCNLQQNMKREEIFNQIQRQYDADKKDHPT